MDLEKIIKESIKNVLSQENFKDKLKGIYIDSLAKVFKNTDVSIYEFELNLKNNDKYNNLKKEIRNAYGNMFDFLRGE